MGTQSFVKTPSGEHQAWLFKLPDEKDARRKDISQSIRDAGKKAKQEKETGKQFCASLALRAETSGVGGAGLDMGKPLGSEPDREKA